MCTNGHGNGCGVDRRDFLKEGAASAVAFGTLGNAAPNQDKLPPTRVLDDPRVEHGKVTFTHNGEASFDGYLARPKATGAFPGVLVIAGNLIAEEYIPNTCAALALAGFVGLAPEVVHHMSDNASDVDKDHNVNDALENILVGMDYLRIQPFVSAGFGVVGFCYGGWLSLLAAARFRAQRNFQTLSGPLKPRFVFSRTWGSREACWASCIYRKGTSMPPSSRAGLPIKATQQM